MRTVHSAGLLAAMAGWTAGMASASTVDVAWTGMGYAETINVSVSGVYGPYSGGVNAGQMHLSLSNSTHGSITDGSYLGFCTDLRQHSESSWQQYAFDSVANLPSPGPQMGAAKAQAIADLYAFAAGAQYGTDAAFACAFQMAIWEVLVDFNNLDIGTGDFVASGYSGAAATYLAQLLGAVGSNSYADIVGVTNDTYQDYIIEVVPGPGSMALLGLGGLVGARRRRR